MTRRAGLVDLSRRFDITWFLGAIHELGQKSKCLARSNKSPDRGKTTKKRIRWR